MQEGKRQKQVSALLLQELSDIFRRLGLSMMEGGLISLTAVKLTPDLLEARVYLSMFQVKEVPAAMKKIEEKGWEIKRELALRVKHQLRRIPTLEYFYDDALEHADKMEALFRKIQEGKPDPDVPLQEGRPTGDDGPMKGQRRAGQGSSEDQKARGEEGPA